MKFFQRKKSIPVAATLAAGFLISATGFISNDTEAKSSEKKDKSTWLAGDHHIHTEWSFKYDYTQNPITGIKGGDAVYPIEKQAKMAKKFGLDWIVTTDHGGPNHSADNLEGAYPDVLKSREKHRDLLHFYGLELNPAGADHVSLIMPKSANEADSLYRIEKEFGRGDIPGNPEDNDEAKMDRAVQYMASLPKKDQPIVFANHPARDHSGIGVYDGKTSPAELRRWNDTAPSIFTGMEGAPGHQADFYGEDKRGRGIYEKAPTLGGYDQMTATLGGFWDAMLGEGRKYWITGTSDMHEHYSDGGREFWPGEYAKTYVKAEKDYNDVMESMRNGRMFVTTGDLISELDVTVKAKKKTAEIGEEIVISKHNRDNLNVEITFRDPKSKNANKENPKVNRVDLIIGEITGESKDDKNPTTKVIKRFNENEFKRHGEYITVSYKLDDINTNSYIRVRGTNTNELEPNTDPKDENPWSDLWFYSNPVFIKVK
ncbi:phosphoesterase [Sporosarcina globispora]|uniref:Phosphoesterase n=1 Tax=Sporosarcina globispora TaxID=1459 RepID=A0A0M0G9R9_SPOGL|nr:phosphoesterase [Sporosarcina globispora]KON86574.1 phosphoesterase [Sporosarcina globispora]